MHVHAAIGEHPLEPSPHPGIVGGQQPGPRRQQVEHEPGGIAPEGATLGAQAVLHRQQQLDAARAPAHDGDAQRPGVRAHPFEQRLPARIEVVDRLDRHDVLGGARHGRRLRRGPDVD